MSENPGTACTFDGHADLTVDAVDAGLVDQAARIFRALGDGPRLRLLALLARGEACVTELAMAEGDHLSTVSQRLRVLRADDLVVRRRQGKHVMYALADRHVEALIANVLDHAAERGSRRVLPAPTSDDGEKITIPRNSRSRRG